MKPKGRSLDEFLDGLGPAERRLLEAAANGEAAEIGKTRPPSMTADNKIRPEFLRFLALGGDDHAPVHEKGLYLKGGWISSKLDLEFCRIPVPITLKWCNVAGSVTLRDAELPGLFLDTTAARGLDAERLDCKGSVYIDDSQIQGLVSFNSARIGGDLRCVGSHFVNEAGDCLQGQEAHITGDLILGYPFERNSLVASGDVDFWGAQIKGDVRCSGVRFGKCVWFTGARIKGDLDFSRCSFVPSNDRAELELERADIGGRLIFSRVTGKAKSFTLRAASVESLVDDMPSWHIADELLLDGFRYNRFLDTEIQVGSKDWIPHSSPTDAKRRIDWLRLQPEFKPQPWEQLIRVFREMGHEEGAKRVAIAKQVEIAKQERIHKSRCVARTLHRIYGLLSGYGYRPGLLILWAIGVAALGVILFEGAAFLGVMAPTDWRVIGDTPDPLCLPERGGNWTTCQWLQGRGYPSFDPIASSFDLITPLIATQQTKDWAPATRGKCPQPDFLGICELSGYRPLGLLFWIFARLETLAGWAFGLMFVAIASGLIKRD